MRSRTRVLASALAVVVATALAACTGDDGSESGDPPAPATPEPLKAAWTSSVPGQVSGTGNAIQPLGDDRVLYAVPGVALAAYDITSGRAWSRRVPQMCTVGEPNAAGDIVLTLGPECRDVAVIDGDTGKRRWRTHIPTVSADYDAGNVVASIGDRTVTVVQFCGQVTRLSLRDGHKLGVLAPHDRACANEADSDGQLIALWHDPESANTPEDYGTGLIPPYQGRATLELYDADTGKRLWRRETDRQTGGLTAGAVVSSDPAILALREHNHMTMRRYSRTGATAEPGAYVGRQLDWLNGVFEPLGVADGVLVGTYGSTNRIPAISPRIFAYDLATGEELWSRDSERDTTDSPQAVGVDSHGVVFTQLSSEHADGESVYGTWVTRWDLRTGEDAGAAAWIEHGEHPPNTWAVAGGLFFAISSDRITAYELPEENPDLTPPDTSVDWADDDVRTDPLIDPCTAVSPATLRQVGLRRSVGLPVPADCTWTEHDQPKNSDRGLRVNVTVAQPGALSEPDRRSEDRTAVQNANAIMEHTEFTAGVAPGAIRPAPMADPKALDGIGDEAYGTSGAVFSAGSGSATGSYLQVRVRNVVVEVEAGDGYLIAEEGSAPVSLHRSEAGVIAAAQDALDSMGLHVDTPPTPDDGRFKHARGVCKVLRDDAAMLGLPEVRNVMPPGHDPRAAECAWRDDNDTDDLTLHAYAAAGSPLTGRTGREVARAVFEESTGRAKPISGLGDQAKVTVTGKADEHSSGQVVVRADNLVVQLTYSRSEDGLDQHVRTEAIRMTREVLRAARR